MNAPIVFQPSDVDIGGWKMTPAEKRALHHFLHRSAVQLAGEAGSTLWHTLIPRLCHSSLSVRNAMTAFSMIHERYNLLKPSNGELVQALQHHQKAVKAINKEITSRKGNADELLEELLVTCLLFICVEVLLGNYTIALTHLNGAVRVVQEHFHARKDPISPELAGLISILGALEVQALSYSRSQVSMVPPIGPGPLQDATVMQTVPGRQEETPPAEMGRDMIKTAGFGLREHIRKILHFLRYVAEPYKYNEVVPQHVIEERDRLLYDLNGFKRSKIDPVRFVTKQYPPAAVIVRMLDVAFHIFLVKLSTCLNSLESSYDRYIPNFRKLVDAAEFVYQNTTRPIFRIESRTIEPLYDTALKCRGHTIRYRALELLRQSKREGIWEGPLVAAVAAYVIQKEEATWLPPDPSTVSEDDETSYARGIAEHNRVHETSIEVHREKRTVSVKCWRLVDGEWVLDSKEIPF